MLAPLVLQIEVDDKGLYKIQQVSNQVTKSLVKDSEQHNFALQKVNMTIGQMKMALIAYAASAGLTLGLIIKSAMQFEQSMKRIEMLTVTWGGGAKASAVEMESLKTQILDLAGPLGSVGELTQGIIEALKAGVPKENVIDFVKNAAKAAKLEGADLASTVQSLDTVMDVFGIDASKASSLIDTLVVAGRRSELGFSGLTAQLGRAAGTLRMTGVDMNEFLAALGVLTSGGMKAGMGIQSLVAFLSKLSNASEQQKKVATELGIDFSIAGLKAKGFAGFIQDLNVKTGGSSEKLALLLEDVQMFKSILPLASVDSKRFSEALGAVKNAAGVADEGLKTLSGSAIGTITAIRNEMEAELIKAVLPMVEQFSKFLLDNKTTIKEWVTSGISVMIAALKLVIANLPIIINLFKAFIALMIWNKISNFWINLGREISTIPGQLGKAATSAEKFGMVFKTAFSAVAITYAIDRLSDSISKLSEAHGVASGLSDMYEYKGSRAKQAAASTSQMGIKSTSTKAEMVGSMSTYNPKILSQFKQDVQEAIDVAQQELIDYSNGYYGNMAKVMSTDKNALDQKLAFLKLEASAATEAINKMKSERQAGNDFEKAAGAELLIMKTKSLEKEVAAVKKVFVDKRLLELQLNQKKEEMAVKEIERQKNIQKEMQDISDSIINEYIADAEKQKQLSNEITQLTADALEERANQEGTSLELKKELYAKEKKMLLDLLKAQQIVEIAQANGNEDTINLINEKYIWLENQIETNFTKKVVDATEDATQKTAAAVQKVFNNIMDLSSATMGLIESMGIDMSEETKTAFDDYMTMVSGTAQFVTSVITGDVMGAIKGAIASLTGMFNLIGDLFGGKSWEDKASDFFKGLKMDFSKLADETKKEMEKSGLLGDDLLRGFASDIIEQLGVQTEDQMGMLSNSLAGQYQDYIASGLSPEEAAKKIQPALNELIATAEENGWKWTESMTAMGNNLSQMNMEVNGMKTYLQRYTEAADGLSQFFYGLTQAMESGFVTDPNSIKIIAGQVANVFNQMIANGATFEEAMEKVDVIIADITASAKKMGLDLAGTGVPELEKYFQLMKDNEGLINMMQGSATAITALASVGALTQDQFNAYLKVGADTYQEMINKGFTQNQALQQSASYLSAVNEAQQRYGFAVDSSTQALIDQAKQQGIIKETEYEMQQKMVAGIEKIADILQRAFDPKVVEDWGNRTIDVLNGVAESADNISITGDEPTRGPGRRNTPKFHDTPAEGFIFKNEGLGLFQKGDMIIPQEGYANTAGGNSGTTEIPVNLTSNVFIGGEKLLTNHNFVKVIEQIYTNGKKSGRIR